MKKDAKIFIAGTSGMVGSAIVRKLLSLGYNNLICSYHSRRPGPSTLLLPENTNDLPIGLRIAKLDLSRQEEVERFFKAESPEYVFLAAAKVGGINANNSYPAQFIYENLAIQTNVIHAAYVTGVKRLLFLGSSCIYPKLAPQPMKEDYLLTGLLEPTNEPYAIAKVAGIKMCESYNRQYGTCFMAVMPTNLYGPNDDFDLQNSHVLPALIRKFHLSKLAAQGDWEVIKRDEACYGPIPADIKKSIGLTESSPLSPQSSSRSEITQSSELSPQTSVTLWGTGSPKREFLHVDDMVDACVFVMSLDETIAAREFFNYPKPCFVNVGCGEDRTIQDLAVIVKEIVGFKGDYIFDASKPDGPPKKLLDVSRLKELGWRSSIGLHQGIKQTYEWYLGRL